MVEKEQTKYQTILVPVIWDIKGAGSFSGQTDLRRLALSLSNGLVHCPAKSAADDEIKAEKDSFFETLHAILYDNNQPSDLMRHYEYQDETPYVVTFGGCDCACKYINLNLYTNGVGVLSVYLEKPISLTTQSVDYTFMTRNKLDTLITDAITNISIRPLAAKAVYLVEAQLEDDKVLSGTSHTARLYELVLMQRATIFRFNREIQKIPNKSWSCKRWHMTKTISESFLVFENNLHFVEVSADANYQRQYAALYDSQNIKEQVKLLDERIEELHNYMAQLIARVQNYAILLLTIITIVIAIVQ